MCAIGRGLRGRGGRRGNGADGGVETAEKEDWGGGGWARGVGSIEMTL